MAIGRSGTGVVTLPSTTSGKLYVTPGAGNIAIHAPIADNGAGVLDLVKSGISTLTLSGANTYTGVTTINTGNLTISHASALGTTAGNTIINATGSTATGGQLQLTGDINSAENITITGLAGILVPLPPSRYSQYHQHTQRQHHPVQPDRRTSVLPPATQVPG